MADSSHTVTPGAQQNKKGRKAYNNSRSNLKKSTRSLANINLDDDNDGQPSSSTGTTTARSKANIDINTIPVTIRIVVGNYPYPQQFIPGIPALETTLGKANSWLNVTNTIEATPAVIEPLQNIYGLSLVDHKEIYICFTDEDGARHVMPIARYNNPGLSGDKEGTGRIAVAWKVKIARGELEHNPRCDCSLIPTLFNHGGERHGVEVIQALKTDNLIVKVQEQQELKSELEARVERLEDENARLRELVEHFRAQLLADSESDEENVSEYEE